MKIETEGFESLSEALYRKSRIKWGKTCRKSLIHIFNRGKSGYTPEDTRELVLSMHADMPTAAGASGEVGYTKEYAPHVEYGHRTVNGGYVNGQYFLALNVRQEETVYRDNLLRALRED